MCSCKLFNKIYMNPLLRTDTWKLRTLCQIAIEIEPKKRKTSRTHAKELNAYLCSTENLKKIKDKLPERCLKKNRKVPDDLYLVDRNVGLQIAKAILPYIKNNKAVVVETNPGFGFITEYLLENDIDKIQAYEPTVIFREHLFKLDKQFPNRMKIFNKDFFSIWKLSYQDRYDNGDRVKNMLKGIQTKDWNDDVIMNIIGILPNPNFIRHLLLSLIFQYGIMTYGRNDLYICLPPFLYWQWVAQPNDTFQVYRSSSVLLQIFCDFKIIKKIPRKAFLPWDNLIQSKQNNKRKLPQYSIDPEDLYLTKISFKPLPVPVDKLQHIWFFVRHLMVSRKNHVIPMLEKWIPGCGWYLITRNPTNDPDIYSNMSIYTRIGDLTPPQILKLFKDFISWPEFHESPFIASLEAALLKMEQGGDALDSSVKEEEHHEEIEIKDNELVQK